MARPNAICDYSKVMKGVDVCDNVSAGLANRDSCPALEGVDDGTEDCPPLEPWDDDVADDDDCPALESWDEALESYISFITEINNRATSIRHQ